MSDEDKEKNFEALRKKVESLEKDNAKLRQLAVKGTVHRAGFDPDNKVVSLVTEKWTVEDLDDLDNPDAFTSFAQEFDLTPTPKSEGTTPTPDNDNDDEDDRIIQGLETANAGRRKATDSATDPSSDDPFERIKAKQAEGDFNGSFMEKLSALPGAISE